MFFRLDVVAQFLPFGRHSLQLCERCGGCFGDRLLKLLERFQGIGKRLPGAEQTFGPGSKLFAINGQQCDTDDEGRLPADDPAEQLFPDRRGLLSGLDGCLILPASHVDVIDQDR